MNQAPHQPTIGFVSLGCPKALVDSERILTQISADGYAISKNYDDADLVIVNTCGLINTSAKTAKSSSPAASACSRKKSAPCIPPCSPSPARKPTNR